MVQYPSLWSSSWLTDTTRPPVSTEVADAILHLLLPLLKPVGDYTREHETRSKRRRKTKGSKSRAAGAAVPATTPHPAISSSLNVGFNSTIRMLEGLIGTSASSDSAIAQEGSLALGEESTSCPEVVFVCRSALPEPICQSLPVMIATASKRARAVDPILLVELSIKAEAAISAALALPRVSVLAIRHQASGTGPLLQLVREHIDPLEIPWLHEAPLSTYLPTKFNTVETTAGAKKSSSRKRKPGS